MTHGLLSRAARKPQRAFATAVSAAASANAKPSLFLAGIASLPAGYRSHKTIHGAATAAPLSAAQAAVFKEHHHQGSARALCVSPKDYAAEQTSAGFSALYGVMQGSAGFYADQGSDGTAAAAASGQYFEQQQQQPSPGFQLVGQMIKVWWPLDRAWYEAVVQVGWGVGWGVGGGVQVQDEVQLG
jgi:hypothetical protein